MGVSYHLVPTNKATGSFENVFSFSGQRFNNEINQLGHLMIQFQDQILDFFGKDTAFFDFIFSLKEHEVSEITFDPAILKDKLEFTLKQLQHKDDFPIPQYHYFSYEDIKEFQFLYVSLMGKELNKIISGTTYLDEEVYDINTSFDPFNQYDLIRQSFQQKAPTVYVKNTAGERTTARLNLDAFPSSIQIEKVERDYGFGKEIRTVHFILKTPFDHFKDELQQLIALCQACIDHDRGIKAYVSY